MVKRILLAGSLLLGFAASPASAQNYKEAIANCGTATPTKSVAGDLEKLQAGRACFARAGEKAGDAVAQYDAAIAALAPKPVPVPDPVKTYWIKCASEDGPCKVPASGTRVRYGANDKFVYRTVNAAVSCGNGTFGDPIAGVVKTCEYESATPPPVVDQPVPDPVPVPVPTPQPAPVSSRAKLGVNVAGISYYSNEPTFANQAYNIAWLSNWQGVAPETLREDGMPLSVERGKAVQGFLIPPAPSYTGGDTTTICTWNGTGELYAAGDWHWPTAQGPNFMEFKWVNTKKPAQLWLEIRYSSAADPMRDLDCRLKAIDKAAFYDPALLDYLKPFGVLRFLDWSRANSSPAVVDWAGRSKGIGVGKVGNDGIALEVMLGLAKANNSSPWLTIPWNADADYHRRTAQLAHDTIAAGTPVYVEISNEVWNYSFWQAHMAQSEGLERKLSDNGFQANIRRLAQKTIEIMPIWEEVFKDRPADLVRVVGTQAGNAWVGGNLFEYDNGAIAKHIDAVAIAPYFYIDADQLTGDHAANMVTLAQKAKDRIALDSKAYKDLVNKWGVRLIAYEGGQHQLDPDNQARLEKMNRDPAMQGIYRQYLTDWNALTGDLFTLYAATGSISRYGAWGLREYAGQPLAETPKLRGVLDFAAANGELAK